MTVHSLKQEAKGRERECLSFREVTLQKQFFGATLKKLAILHNEVQQIEEMKLKQ